VIFTIVKLVFPTVFDGQLVADVQTAREKMKPFPAPAVNPTGGVQVSATLGGVDGSGTCPRHPAEITITGSRVRSANLIFIMISSDFSDNLSHGRIATLFLLI
jgi:hypothetical protein